MSRRRSIRRPLGGGGGGVGTVVPQLPPLPSTAVEYWHGEMGFTAGVSWVGRIAGIPLSTIGAVTQTADGTNFMGRRVVQTTEGASGLRNAAAGTVIANGTRPYVYSIFRYRTMPSVDDTYGLIDLGVDAVSDPYYLRLQRASGGASLAFGVQGAGGTVIALDPMNTAVHQCSAWLDGTNNNVQLDATLTQAASAATMPSNVTSIGVGVAASGVYHTSSTSHAFHLICSAKPTSTEIAQLDTWAQRYWGAP